MTPMVWELCLDILEKTAAAEEQQKKKQPGAWKKYVPVAMAATAIPLAGYGMYRALANPKRVMKGSAAKESVSAYRDQLQGVANEALEKQKKDMAALQNASPSTGTKTTSSTVGGSRPVDLADKEDVKRALKDKNHVWEF